MRHATILAACACALLPAQAAADTVKPKTGLPMLGMILELRLRTPQGVRAINREELVSVHLSPTADDTLELWGGEKLQGTILQALFKKDRDPVTLARDVWEDITLDAPSAQAWNEMREERSCPLTDAQKQALARNRELRRAALLASQDLGAQESKAATDDLAAATARIERIEAIVEDKIIRRRRASIRIGSGGTQYRTARERLERTDGLARDQEALQKAKAELPKLQAAVRAAAAKSLEREARIQAAYQDHRKRILAGDPPTDDAMTAAYKTALAPPDAQPPAPHPAK